MAYAFKTFTVEAFQFTAPLRAQVLAAVAVDPGANVQGVFCTFDDGQPIFFIRPIPGATGFPSRVILTNWIVEFPSGRKRVFSNREFDDTFEVVP